MKSREVCTAADVLVFYRYFIGFANRLMEPLISFNDECCREDFDAIPFIIANGYQSKTIAYSIWHIFRIEDIASHALINEDKQVFFLDN